MAGNCAKPNPPIRFRSVFVDRLRPSRARTVRSPGSQSPALSCTYGSGTCSHLRRPRIRQCSLLAVRDGQMTGWWTCAGENFCRSETDVRVVITGSAYLQPDVATVHFRSFAANNWLKYCYWPIPQILVVHVFHPACSDLYICWLVRYLSCIACHCQFPVVDDCLCILARAVTLNNASYLSDYRTSI